MLNIIIDLPITSICASDSQTQLERQSLERQQICLSLLLLLIPYGYLLYLHLSSLWILHSKNLFKQLDKLDLWLTFFSVMRMLMVFLFLIINHFSGIIFFALLNFAWQIALLLVYFKFVIDNKKHWVIISFAVIFIYLVFCVLCNYLYYQTNSQSNQSTFLVVPLFYPLLVIDLIITLIAVFQFFSISNALSKRFLTSNIIMQLKHRRSFIFQTLVACWISFLMRKYPNIFMPIVGVVLFYLLSDWLNIAIIFRCILHRVVRNNQQEEVSDDSTSENKYNSNLIVVELQDFSNPRN